MSACVFDLILRSSDKKSSYPYMYYYILSEIHLVVTSNGHNKYKIFFKTLYLVCFNLYQIITFIVTINKVQPNNNQL